MYLFLTKSCPMLPSFVLIKSGILLLRIRYTELAVVMQSFRRIYISLLESSHLCVLCLSDCFPYYILKKNSTLVAPKVTTVCTHIRSRRLINFLELQTGVFIDFWPFLTIFCSNLLKSSIKKFKKLTIVCHMAS